MRKALARVAGEFRPDVVYERYSLYQTAGLELCRRNSIPRVLEVNTLLADELAPRLHWPGSARRVERSLWRRERAIICVSTHLKQMMKTSAGLDEANMAGFTISPDAVDPEVFSAAAEPTRDPGFGTPGKKIVGYMGTLTAWHGIDLFFDAARILRDEQREIMMVAVGGEGARLERLRERARKEGVEQTLQFFGSIPFAAVPSYLARMGSVPHTRHARLVRTDQVLRVCGNAAPDCCCPLLPLRKYSARRSIVAFCLNVETHEAWWMRSLQ